jgi:hypothetical protein
VTLAAEPGDYLVKDAGVLVLTGGYGASMSSNHCMRGDFTERLLPA